LQENFKVEKKNVRVVGVPLVGRHVVNNSGIASNVGCHVVIDLRDT
jgi:UDP-N-acetylmuramate-alanine ligase